MEAAPLTDVSRLEKPFLWVTDMVPNRPTRVRWPRRCRLKVDLRRSHQVHRKGKEIYRTGTTSRARQAIGSLLGTVRTSNVYGRVSLALTFK